MEFNILNKDDQHHKLQAVEARLVTRSNIFYEEAHYVQNINI